MGDFKPTGVNPQLVWNVRRALDREGFQHVKVVVSGGFTVEKIRQFEEQEVPVDMYGVGSSLFQGRFDFTADVVRVEGKPLAKVGRSYRPNPRLQRVECEEGRSMLRPAASGTGRTMASDTGHTTRDTAPGGRAGNSAC
jgi:nicotinate phosphoribosyltransferase